MTPRRIYVIAAKDGKGAKRLIRAAHPSNALRHVAEDTLTVEVASQDALVELLGSGIKVESVGAEQAEIET